MAIRAEILCKQPREATVPHPPRLSKEGSGNTTSPCRIQKSFCAGKILLFPEEENSLEASPLFASFSPVKPSPSQKGLLFYEDRRQRVDAGATKCRSLEDSNDDVYSIRRTINAGARSGGGGGKKTLFGLSDKPEKRIHQTMAVMEEQKRGEKVVIFSPPSLSRRPPSFLPVLSESALLSSFV